MYLPTTQPLSPFTPQLVFTLIWILGCFFATCGLLSRPHKTALSLSKIILIALFMRIVPALVLPRGARYEMHVFELAAEAFLSGENIYYGTIAHPYAPFHLYWFALSDWLADQTVLPFVFWLKSLNAVADTAITYLVYKAIAQKKEASQAHWGALLYAINPVTIMVAVYQGQVEAITMFFLVLAWYLFTFHPQQLIGSAMALGVAILSKLWPILFLFIVWIRLPNWYARVKYSLICALVPLTAVFIYELQFPTSAYRIILWVLSAGSIYGWWGYSALTHIFVNFTGTGSEFHHALGHYGELFGRFIGFATLYLTRKQSALYALLIANLAIFATVPNLGIQGLSWIVPLAIIYGSSKELGWYIGGSTLHMVVAYWGLHITGKDEWLYLFVPEKWGDALIQLSSIPIWLIIVWWGIREIKKEIWVTKK